MTTVWQGNVLLPAFSDGIRTSQNVQLDDLSLQLPRMSSNRTDQQPWNYTLPECSFFPTDAKLQFTAYVETARVPLSLLHGPRLEACTLNRGTEQWLWEVLVENQLQYRGKQAQCLTNDVYHTAFNTRNGGKDAAAPLRPCVTFESQTALLFHVDSPTPSNLSHILLYAASTLQHQRPAAESGLETPPRSSSPTVASSPTSREIATSSSQPAIHVYAQPLGSLARLSSQCPTPPGSPLLEPNSGIFLPLPTFDRSAHDPPAVKRPRLDIFSAASSAQKRHHRRGGKGVAQLMASTGGPSNSPTAGLARAHTTGSFTAPSLPIDRSVAAAKTAGSRPTSRHASPLLSRPGSRATSRLGLSGGCSSGARVSAGSDHGDEPIGEANISHQDQQQPRYPIHGHSYNHGQSYSQHSRHASLQRVASLDILGNQTSRHSTPETEREVAIPLSKTGSSLPITASPATANPTSEGIAHAQGTHPGTLDAANKAALSRIVLAALRMWGHAASSGSSSGSGNNNAAAADCGRNDYAAQQRDVGVGGPSPAPASAPFPEEDFKSLYHATYSATKFALRHEPRVAPWAPDRMRERVEQVLGVFLGG